MITATTEVVISEKLNPELASVELSGTAVSRMSTMRMVKFVLDSKRHCEERSDEAIQPSSLLW
ncbi:MAG: hypothetical protein WAM99_12165, partial [Xanthobacteraceae bacterium]